MTTKFEIPNKTPNTLLSDSSVKPLYTLINPALWLIVLLFVSQLLIGFIGGIFVGYQNTGEVSMQDIQSMFSSVPTLLIITLLAGVFNIPLLMVATPAKGWQAYCNYWALSKPTQNQALKWLLISALYWLGASIVGELVRLPVEQFMIDLKLAADSVSMILLIIIAVCVVAPIMEELIFRGWLFSHVAQTKLGRIGALLLTSIIFSAIHSHYDHIFTFVILLSFGLLLGFIRFKTDNIVYCIISHSVFNSLAMVALFYFEF